MTTENTPPSGDKDDSAKGSDKPDTHMIPKSRLDEEITKRKSAETALAEMVETVLSEIPDNLKGLIPADLSPSQKLSWFKQAKATGVFSGTVTVPATDTKKPATAPKDRDPSTLPAHARIAAGYRKA